MAKPEKEESELIVLTDGRGNTYLLDSATLTGARVPEERRAEVEEALETGEAVGGAMRLTPTKTDYKISAFRLQHAGGLSIAERLRSL